MGRTIGREVGRFAIVGIVLVALLALAAGMVSRSGPTTASADLDRATPSSMDHAAMPMDHGASPMDHMSSAALDGSTPCEKAAAVTPALAQGGAAHGHFGPTVDQPLDAATAAELERQLAAARSFATRFPTAADAVAAGYAKGVPYLPCIAAHYTNHAYVDGAFDPGQPEQLLYGGNTADAPLVGVSYLVFSGANPPEGFAGPNDEWHQHVGLCVRGDAVIGGTGLTDEQCAQRGGRKTEEGEAWMLHVWLVPGHESAWGIFSGDNPALGALSATHS
jgi:hypothetical protein